MHTVRATSAFLSILVTVTIASPLPSPVNSALLPRQSTQSCTDDYPLTAGAAASGSNENSTTSSTSECGLLGCTSSGSAASEGDTSTSSSSTDLIDRAEDEEEVAMRYMKRVYGEDWLERMR
ncbi:hypothetical protein D0866_08263 [Hortaea werneckii]|uniref:Uncharacterized protein n=1 Tax=Hortaea werneckii TaxID=91943 RepID=A0A3M7AS53_HORWE|nr:hypothetical protein D0866_08263 [Hortaea werneckii]